MKHARILVVDDESLDRWSLKDRFERDGIDVLVDERFHDLDRYPALRALGRSDAPILLLTTLADLPNAVDAILREEKPDGASFDLPPSGLSFADLERRLVQQALARTGGNQTRAAALLGMNRDQIRYRIEKFGLAQPHREGVCT